MIVSPTSTSSFLSATFDTFIAGTAFTTPTFSIAEAFTSSDPVNEEPTAVTVFVISALATSTWERASNAASEIVENNGLKVDPKFVIDANCGVVNVSQPTGRFNMTTQVKFPFLPVVTNFADFPITKGLEQILLNFPSPISFSGDSNAIFTPLALSSNKSGLLSLPTILDVKKQWSGIDFQSGEQIVAALLELNNRNKSKIVLVSSGDLAVNGTGQQPRRLQPDNVSLMVNSIEWLSDETGLIDLRTKGITSRPIEQLSESKKNIIKWLNFLLPILLVIVYGVIRMQRRRNQRMKRMQEGWVK